MNSDLQKVLTSDIGPEQEPADEQTAASNKAAGDGRLFWRTHRIWWLVAFVLVCIPGVLIQSSYEDAVGRWVPETVPNPSTFNKRMSGYSGMFELAEKIGLKPLRWQYAYRELAERQPHGTLVIVSPWAQPSENDCQYIADWVKKGNDVIYLDYFSFENARRPIQSLSMDATVVGAGPLSRGNQPGLAGSVNVAEDIPERAHVDHLMVKGDTRIVGGRAVVPANGGSLFAVTKYGDGRVLVGCDPTICANQNLNDQDYKGNFQFLANWLTSSQQPILFDEKSHGYTASANVFLFLLKSPVGFILLQLLLITAVAMISLNQRFGSPRLVSNARRISNLEFIDGLAAAYQRARARSAVWVMIFNPFKSKLCRKVGVAPHEGIDVLATAWSETAGGNKRELEEFLLNAQRAAEQENISEQELSELVSTCDRLSGGAKQVAPVNRIMGA